MGSATSLNRNTSVIGKMDVAAQCQGVGGRLKIGFVLEEVIYIVPKLVIAHDSRPSGGHLGMRGWLEMHRVL